MPGINLPPLGEGPRAGVFGFDSGMSCNQLKRRQQAGAAEQYQKHETALIRLFGAAFMKQVRTAILRAYWNHLPYSSLTTPKGGKLNNEPEWQKVICAYSQLT